ncbi:hypothetical protein [Halobacteriovorax marinus]|nr:hypothetical protein [Halobacteriovorax marinus]
METNDKKEVKPESTSRAGIYIIVLFSIITLVGMLATAWVDHH